MQLDLDIPGIILSMLTLWQVESLKEVRVMPVMLTHDTSIDYAIWG